MCVADWNVPFTFTTPYGTLQLNQLETFDSGTGMYLFDTSACKVAVPLRFEDVDLPQFSGEDLGERFFGAFRMKLSIQLWETTDVIACDDLAQDMLDHLLGFYRSFANPLDGRIYWTPDGEAQRMIRKCQLSEAQDTTVTDDQATTVAFEVKSPYPYAWTAAETTTALDATLTNTGTADFWPVIKVYGPTSAFTIENASVTDEDGNPLQITYDAGLPGAISIPVAEYAEIDTFGGTIYLNGDEDNLKPGLDMAVSDWFPIQVGANVITITGATADVLWQDAWAA